MKRPGLKRKRYLFILLGITLLILLHIVLKFRSTDTFTRQFFQKAGLQASIAYQNTSAYEQPIRIISVSADRNKPHVLFIHGAPGSGDAFYDYLKDPKLLSRANLHTFDRPGYGFSGFGKPLLPLSEQAQVVADLIKTQKWKNVLVVGHSYGGPIATYASLLSKNIRGILLLAPAMDPLSERYFWVGNFARWKATRWLLPKAIEVATAEKYHHEFDLREQAAHWQQVHCPITVIHGRKDLLVPFENLNYTVQNFSNAKVRTVPLANANHFIPWTRHEVIAKEILLLLEQAKHEMIIPQESPQN